jgi:hypothetical protein
MILVVSKGLKRDLALALPLGALVELCLWYITYVNDSDLLTGGSYPLLNELQKPGVAVAFLSRGEFGTDFILPTPGHVRRFSMRSRSSGIHVEHSRIRRVTDY